MSDNEVNFIFVGSIVCTISCVSVPAPTTGMDAVRSTVEPGAIVDEDAASVTEPEADTAVMGNDTMTTATAATVEHARRRNPTTQK